MEAAEQADLMGLALMAALLLNPVALAAAAAEADILEERRLQELAE